MVKSTFTQRSQRCVQFISFAFHVHKSTFKGLSTFYESYSEIQHDYSANLLKLSKSMNAQIQQFKREIPVVRQILNQIITSLQANSQFHFNYSERLKEISCYYSSQYQQSKRKKDQKLKIIKDKNESQYEKAVNNKNREIMDKKQQQICKSLFDALSNYKEQQYQRVRKIKEQSIISFSLLKKIKQKQIESANAHSHKLIKTQIEIVNKQSDKIEKQIIDQYSQYGSDVPLIKKSTIHKLTHTINRESLRQSIILKQKIGKVQDFQTKIKSTIEKYQAMPLDLLVELEQSTQFGLFDDTQMKNRIHFARQINNVYLKTIFYQMIHRFYLNTQSSQTKISLLMIKKNLQIGQCKPNLKAGTQREFLYVNKQKNDLKWQWHMSFLIMLSQFYSMSLGQQELLNFLSKPKYQYYMKYSDKQSFDLSFSVKSVCLDTLLDTLIVKKDGQSILYYGFNDVLPTILLFGKDFLSVSPKTTILLLLKKFLRVLKIAPSNNPEQLELIEKIKIQQNRLTTQQSGFQKKLKDQIFNAATQNILQFYKANNSFVNSIKLLLAVQQLKIGQGRQFTTLEHTSQCLKAAGWKYISSIGQDRFSFESNIWKGQDRLKNIVQMLQMFQLQAINSQFFEPAANQLSNYVGVGKKALESKMRQVFIQACTQLIDKNLQLLAQQTDIDRDGYILRLGLFLAKIDQYRPRLISYYDKYFIVLDSYLKSTEKDYDVMLERSRQTELWIAQQNSQATQNCIDFCSLLYRPFQFLLSTVKQLEKSDATDFQRKFSDYIKLRLNMVLKQQIFKYTTFLYESLKMYNSNPSNLSLKPKRNQLVQKISQQRIQSQRNSFKQITRRLYNLLFLKDHLQQMICDFIDQSIYSRLEMSIYNIDKLKKIISQSTHQTKAMLENICSIVIIVLETQKRIVQKSAEIAVYHFWKRIFSNIYFQQQKNAVEQFFSTKQDYKLSKYTLVQAQTQIQDLLSMIGKNIPQDFLTEFSRHFLRSFQQAYRYEILNCNKFRLPLKQSLLIPYLQKDISFISTMMKQRYFEQDLVHDILETPLYSVLEDIQSPYSKITEIFQKGTLQNNRDKCLYALVILNLRVKDQKAKQFVKKYKESKK